MMRRGARRAAEHSRPAADAPQPHCMDTAKGLFEIAAANSIVPKAATCLRRSRLPITCVLVPSAVALEILYSVHARWAGLEVDKPATIWGYGVPLRDCCARHSATRTLRNPVLAGSVRSKLALVEVAVSGSPGAPSGAKFVRLLEYSTS